MTAMHCYLQERTNDIADASETVLHGPSTQNKIERWWRELLERMERYFKVQLNELLEDGNYDPSNENDPVTIFTISDWTTRIVESSLVYQKVIV